MDLARMVTGSSPLRPLGNRPLLHAQSINHVTQPSPSTTHSPLLAKRPQGGNYCANPNCNPRMHSRRQGNADCCESFCLNCCQLAAAEAEATHKSRARCPVRSHRVNRQSRSSAPLGVLPPIQPIELDVSASNGTIVAPLPGPALAHARSDLLVAHDSRYAQPLARMWQETTPEWLEAKQDASRQDMSARGRKKAAAATKVVHRQMVNVHRPMHTWARVPAVRRSAIFNPFNRLFAILPTSTTALFSSLLHFISPFSTTANSLTGGLPASSECSMPKASSISSAIAALLRPFTKVM